jgi:hypothetical protein
MKAAARKRLPFGDRAIEAVFSHPGPVIKRQLPSHFLTLLKLRNFEKIASPF